MIPKKCLWLFWFTAVAISATAPSYLVAEQETVSRFDRLWGYARLYDNQDNRFLQRFALSGRIQPEAAWFDTNKGEFADELLWRRFRFGFKASVFRKWLLHVEGDFDLNKPLGNRYTRLTDAYVGWLPQRAVTVKFLKQSVGFTLDGATSSKNLLTMQRNVLTSNLWFTGEYFTGVGAKGNVHDRWVYNVGLFSSEDADEISSFQASYFALISVGYRFKASPKLDTGLIRIDYVYNEEDVDSGTADFSQVLSLVTKWQTGPWGLWTDVAAGNGYAEQSDVLGLVAMAFYDFNARYQGILRYTFVASAGENGIRLPRYPDEIVAGSGDEYSEIYFGFNVYFYGHKLKWQTGVEYESMKDRGADGGEYAGWGLNTGLRMSW